MENYEIVFENLINEIKEKNEKPTLLLHSCCAPCSTAVLNRLKDYFNVTVYYYNPCIYPFAEYEKRRNEQIRFINILNSEGYNIKFLDCDYDDKKYYEKIKGFEKEPEGGKRCYVCYTQRIEQTAKKAKELNFEYFGTTLSVSPHKNAQWINEIGSKLQNELNIKFLFADFKKKNGFLNSINFSKEFNIYRQDYCGCVFSLHDENK